MKTIANDLVPHSMDVDSLQKSVPSAIEGKKFAEKRPNFVNKSSLLERYRCSLCSDILVIPQQTPCGNRVCKQCIDELFRDQDHIPSCPLPHEDMDEDDMEECQTKGLFKSDLVFDHAVSNALQREKCFCSNQPYGCCERLPHKRLKDHEMQCEYRPQPCPNKGCPEFFAADGMSGHLALCQYTDAKCKYCHQSFFKKDIENHLGECDLAVTQCTMCKRQFENGKLLETHQRITADCLTRPGKCYYYDYCSFETENVRDLQQHLKSARGKHLECLTLEVVESRESSNSSQNIKSVLDKKLESLTHANPVLEKNVKNIEKRLQIDAEHETDFSQLVANDANNSRDVRNVEHKIANIEKQIKDNGLDRVTVIESHSQSIRRNQELINDAEKRVRNMEMTSYDGSLIWMIKDYKRRKSDAVRGRELSIYSQPFHTSRYGFKMRLKGYLNGDGLGRGQCLSLFFVLMRGEYDELLQFPFKQRVTFTLLCPSNPELSKSESFLPDPDSPSFRRPQTEMNIESGCPQFALHSDVESSNFLVDDCIRIKVSVEPGGDEI